MGQVYFIHGWQPLPYRRRLARTGHGILRGVLRQGRVIGGRQPTGNHMCPWQSRRHPKQFKGLPLSGHFGTVYRVPGTHAARVRHIVQPPERPWLLCNVLRDLPPSGARLHSDRRFDK